MKLLLMLLLSFPVLLSAQTSIYETSLYTGTVFLFLLLLAIIVVQMKKASQEKEILKEKESKITWLRQVHAENEHRHLKQVQELEKEILKLNHTIEKLELQLAEGTKNQVVEKIEALQKKRNAARA